MMTFRPGDNRKLTAEATSSGFPSLFVGSVGAANSNIFIA